MSMIWNYKQKPHRVAVFRKMSKVRDGVRCKKYWAKFKWPEEEIGKNSAMPWIRPKRIFWINIITELLLVHNKLYQCHK